MSVYVHKQTYIRMLITLIFKVEITQENGLKKWNIRIMEHSQQRKGINY